MTRSYWISCSIVLLLWAQIVTADSYLSHSPDAHAHHENEPEHDMSSMHGMYGPYPLTREASGTSWLPDSSTMEGMHRMGETWTTMTHGLVNAIYDHQGGPRGDDKTFSTSMLMVTAQRQFGDGTLGLRGMVSLDPLMGKRGYPELLQTGETADGRNPLVDRQHPHDFFMELATAYSVPLSEQSSVFAYVGLPGEPALGPPAFMHRLSSVDNPEAPISHHWLDSTHIVYGVATLGYVYRNWKIEGSIFHGREPDQNRYNIETGPLDSGSVRLSFNPAPTWALQVSRGRLHSAEQLEPEVNIDRTTASAIYNAQAGEIEWQTTFAWGRNAPNIGQTTDAYLLESAVRFRSTHTVFGRIERADKNELFTDGDPLAGQTFRVSKLSVGYVYDFLSLKHIRFGIGGLVSTYTLPRELDPAYGDPRSYLIFARVKLQ